MALWLKRFSITAALLCHAVLLPARDLPVPEIQVSEAIRMATEFAKTQGVQFEEGTHISKLIYRQEHNDYDPPFWRIVWQRFPGNKQQVYAVNVYTSGIIRSEIDSVQRQNALKTMLNFEQTLIPVGLVANMDTVSQQELLAQRKKILAYFAGIDDVALKIAALEAMYSRYVFYIDQETARVALPQFLADSDRNVVYEAIKTVAAIGAGKQFQQHIIQLLQAPQEYRTLSALFRTMHSWNETDLKRYLLPYLEHNSLDLKMDALVVLTMADLELARPYIRSFLKDPNTDIRRRTLQATSSVLHDNEIWEQVKKALNDHDKSVRLQALQHMQYIGREEGMNICREHLGDQESLIKKQAENCIEYRNKHRELNRAL